MEDFGYSKASEVTQSKAFIKKALMLGAAIFSIACFIYITINAYYYVYKENNNNIETIKAAANPLKVIENEVVNNSETIADNSIYEDIFGTRKKNQDKNIKLRENIEPALPPKPASSAVVDVEDVSKTLKNKPLKNENKEIVKKASDKIIVYSDNQDVQNGKSLLTQNNATEKTKKIVEPAKQDNTVPAVLAQAKSTKKSIRVQIAALSSKDAANDFWKKTQNANSSLFSGLKPFIEEVNLGRRGIFYRLQIGNFYDQVKAEQFCNSYVAKMQKSKADCIVVE